jgi:FlaA1/EpsC-like NDP-sugar epimerase
MFNFKRVTVVIYDFLTIPLAWLGAYWVRQNLSEIPQGLFHELLKHLPLVIVIQAIAFWLFGLYRGEWRFASIPDMMRIIKSIFVGAVTTIVLLYFTSVTFDNTFTMPPRSIIPLYSLLLFFLVGGARLVSRAYREMRSKQGFKENVLIVGAGLAGEALIRELLRDNEKRYYPRILVDDNLQKKGIEILGVRVVGCTQDIPQFVNQYNIQKIFIAIPSAHAKAMQSIVDICNRIDISYRTLPGLKDLAAGNVSINDLREVSLEDLLGREPINFHDPALQKSFEWKTILVTGGGGSIGSELCRQISLLNPERLIIFEHSEFNLYEIELELKEHFPQLKLSVHLQDITEKNEVERLIEHYQPDIIFHAAAYKHVPLLEHQVIIAAKNNVLGTKIVAEAAAKYKVKKFVLISTDKAVNPTNVMGTTKRIAEIFCQNLNRRSETQFITVRFGNVLGSAGSVVPLFQKQLKAGGPLTVTHPDITRYFMTIPEACQLILQASLLGHGGEIFILDMGQPIKIQFLAEQLIKLSGKRLGEDIEIKYTGLREGEKLYEELFHANEALQDTQNQKIFRANAREMTWEMVFENLQQLESACRNIEPQQALSVLSTLVPEAHLKGMNHDAAS